MGSRIQNITIMGSLDEHNGTNYYQPFGSPANMDLCSKCYREFRLLEEQTATLSLREVRSSTPPKSTELPTTAAVTSRGEGGKPTPKVVNRCDSCRKKVGLTGFNCKCGGMFCGMHRYAETHGCTFDYKRSAADQIAKANPLVKADKLARID